MADEGATKATQSGNDDTIPASGSPEGRSSVPAIPPPPDHRYKLGAELGRGGMGRVVEAYDTHLQRTVALKEVLPTAGNIDRRFQREVRITARLEHASIVPLYDSGRLADGRPFYVMRRVSGKPLDDAVTRARTLEGRLALLPNALSAIEAVAHAHKRGVIHRDLKPQNILVGELGETVVIDWGLAKVIGDDDEPVHDSLEPRLPTAADSLQTQVGSVFGTPGFMPPEQARGEDLGPQGDVYALGATLYQVIVGRPPFGGTSATDVISSTLRHRLEPIARACPGAPPELVTIIEKALAFEPGSRYPNAGALAEDVRRFLTGQLVAAHRYTKRQRIARFARRHRAPLVVAALASVGIAVLAWISVHRIVRERDTAETASIEAREQRRRAEDRAAEIRERADQLTLLHARSLLETSPTQTIAVLKQIDGGSPLVRDEARALARAAVMRGVAWGMPVASELSTSLEMTKDGTRALHAARSGELQVFDLDARREIVTYQATRATNARWVAGDRKILLNSHVGPLQLFDPVTRAIEPLGLSDVASLSVTDDGSVIAAVDGSHRLWLLDLATRTVTSIPNRSPHHALLLAPDGSWIAFDEKIDEKRMRLVVVDPTGKLLVQREGLVNGLGASPTGKLAVAFASGVFEIERPALGAAFTPIPYDLEEIWRLLHLIYRDDKLYLVDFRSMHVWNGKKVTRVRTFTDGTLFVAPLRDGVVALSAGDGRIVLVQGGVSHSVQVTQRPSGMAWIAGTPGSSRLIARSREALLVWDTAQVFPRWLPVLGSVSFASESVLVTTPGMVPHWEWMSLTDLARTKAPLETQLSMPRSSESMASDGRSLVVLERTPDRSTAVIAPPGGKQLVIDNIAYGLARLVEGNAVVFSPGKGRVLGKVGDEEARELVMLDADVAGLAPLGPLGYVALSKKGELVRGRFDGSGFARTRVSGDEIGFVATEVDGSVLIAMGNRLLRWGTAANAAVEEVARFTARIHGMRSLPVGTVISLAGNELMFMAATGDRTPRRMPVGDRPAIADAAGRVVSINVRSELEVLELPSLVTWTFPHLYTPQGFLSVSPSGSRVYQPLGLDAALWTIPEPGSDFAAYLDEQTNATEADRQVAWPFTQAPL